MKTTIQTTLLATAIISTLALSGCVTTNASKTGGSDYRTAETRKAGEVQYGTLVNVRTVAIRENESVENLSDVNYFVRFRDNYLVRSVLKNS